MDSESGGLPADSDGGDISKGDQVEGSTPEVFVEEGENGPVVVGGISGDETPGASAPAGPGSDLDCTSEQVVANDLVETVYFEVDPKGSGNVRTDTPNDRPLASSNRSYSPTGRWARVRCFDDEGVPTSNDLLPVGGPSATLGELLADALLELDPPIHDVELRPNGRHLVQFPSLYWVDPVYWNTERSAFRTNGNVTLDVTLVPFQSEWDPGDGSETVVCFGPGEVWEWGVDPEDHECKHVYQTVEGSPFTVTSTVLFEIQTATNSTEVLGPFAPLPRVAEAEVEVREIQVVESN